MVCFWGRKRAKQEREDFQQELQNALDAQDADAPEIPSFFGSFVVCMKKYFDISGRASWKEFWSFFALTFPFAWLPLPFYFMWVLDPEFTPDPLTRGVFFWIGVSGLSFAAATFLPLMAATARRVHDVDVSSVWLIFLFLLWGVGWIATLVILLRPGSKGWNGYGPAPRRRPRNEQIDREDAFETPARDGRPLRTFWFDPTNFHGVADRFEYFGSLLIYLAVAAALWGAFRFYILGRLDAPVGSVVPPLIVFMGYLVIGLTFSILATTVRRLHDVGYSGLWVLTLLPPATVFGLPFLAFLMFQSPKIVGNKYARRFI
ncbi:MAG: DUF805 domain-containing protein [Thermoguttaceae bacterium]|nr:DUF805 domain-containing protein [Thermoguttaceae bacterium]